MNDTRINMHVLADRLINDRVVQLRECEREHPELPPFVLPERATHEPFMAWKRRQLAAINAHVDTMNRGLAAANACLDAYSAASKLLERFKR